jgi:SAM-dependent methyltransferase
VIVGEDRNHYSYTVYADPRTADGFDAARFGGPIGALVAEAQERFLLSTLQPRKGLTVVDVGSGTGRAACFLAGFGAGVTAMDASAEMMAVAARRAAEAGLDVRFARGDAHALAFPDRSFDAAVCLRVIMHTPGWRTVVGELCRVARRQVIVDYPALGSAAVFQSAARRAAGAAGRRVEAYRVFRDRTIRDAFASHGFRVIGLDRQFVLPIAFHKTIGSAGFTTRVERLLESIGLLRLCGSPVTVVAERIA